MSEPVDGSVPEDNWDFWIDVGGTFTDCVARGPHGENKRFKLLSTGIIRGEASVVAPDRLTARLRNTVSTAWASYHCRVISAAGVEWTTRIMDSTADGLVLADRLPMATGDSVSIELFSNEPAPIVAIRCLLEIPLEQDLPPLQLRLGTTRGTNALLTRTGARTGLLITKGFRDLLSIGNQDRPRLFELSIRKPSPLFDSVVEVEERIAADGKVLRNLDEGSLSEALQQWKNEGIESIAISFLNSFMNDEHERRATELASKAGFKEISGSAALAPVIKYYPRAQTTVVDAYLNPVLKEYIESIRACLQKSSENGPNFRLMTSAGGLVGAHEFHGKDSVLSGPAGGVVGFAGVAQALGFERAIGFDMGGTSTDVARFDGEFEFDYEVKKAGVDIMTPTLAIETVAAGGGSICHFDGVRLQVGPASAGANPGPACYGRGGPLTVTDVNVFLGRIAPAQFPFPLDVDAIQHRLETIAQQVNQDTDQDYTVESLAEGFRRIANTNMSAAIRSVSVAKGFDPRDFPLVCFGGAGGQHACAIADELNMSHCIIHPDAGILSALGMGLAEVTRHAVEGIYAPLASDSADNWEKTFAGMKQDLVGELAREGFTAEEISVTPSIELRFVGQDASLHLFPSAEIQQSFHEAHTQRYGFTYPEREIEVVSLKLRATAHAAHALPKSGSATKRTTPVTKEAIEQWHHQHRISIEVFDREADLTPGDVVAGPALIAGALETTVVDRDWQAEVMSQGELLLTRTVNNRTTVDETDAAAQSNEIADPVLLEVFHHHFASIAEQMGHTLRNTSSSVNIKERLDFSCAIFTARGELVVNAPHIPVHLGAMSETVKQVLRDNPNLEDGDVIVTNNPYRGGSHLPDITVVTPVFESSADHRSELRFFTASRAHHAEVGGISPGSMPPFSSNLAEEGVLIDNFKLIRRGESQFDELERLLTTAKYPSRCPADNLADLAAQVAANQQGVNDLHDLIQRYGWPTVQAYMMHIQSAAENKTRKAIGRLPGKTATFTDRLTNGARIVLELSVVGDELSLDFTGTDPAQSDNLNANRAIVTAAVLYSLRLLVNEDIPMNEGVLAPVRLTLPECLLNPTAGPTPAESPAIVGGNVETSQRVVDILLAALDLAAASQGTMNNFVFGNDQIAYYETICGGEGGSIRGAGASAVHTHMTNTRITDPEVFEQRYPIRLRRFEVRQGSGGSGKADGGDGIIREVEFLIPLQVSLLTQRRGENDRPFGLHGGQPGMPGLNIHIRRDGSTKELPARFQGRVEAGDRIHIETPGGGGYGAM